jgi:5'-nucleotidase
MVRKTHAAGAAPRIPIVRFATCAVALLLLSGVLLFAQTFTLLHVNDTHSHLDMTGPKDANLDGTVGGIAKAATVIGMTKAMEPNVLVLHAGDVFHGDLFFNKYFGVPEFQIMRQVGFDAMAVGNHEFDFGPGVLAMALSQAYGTSTLPLLSANLDLSGYPALATWIQPNLIKEVGGVKVGIFSMTVPNVPTSMPDPVVILGGDDPAVLVTIAYQQMAALRAQGAQVVIFLSHLGYLYDEAVATNVPGIDLIVGGHDHYLFESPVIFTNPLGKAVPYVQAGKHYNALGKMHFTYAAGAVTVDDYQIIPLDSGVPGEPTVQAVVAQLKAGIVQQYGDVYHTVVADAPAGVTMTYDPDLRPRDTGMGNLIADALRDHTGTDIAITPNGLISEGLAEGPIVGADIFRPVSYGYDPATGLGLQVATFRISAAMLWRGLETGLYYLPYNEDVFLQVSGMRFAYNANRTPFFRVRTGTIRINGKPIRWASTYTVTANTGVVALLPQMGIEVTDLQILPDLEYDVLKTYIQKLGTVTYESEGRIRDRGVAP